MYKQLLYTTYSYQKLSNKLNAQLEFTLEGFTWRKFSPRITELIIRDSGIETTQTTRLEPVKCNQSVIDMDTMGHLDEKSLLTSMFDRFKEKGLKLSRKTEDIIEYNGEFLFRLTKM